MANNNRVYIFYTKIIILASIYSSAIMIWINDKSDNLDKTFNFLDKSIMNMNMGLCSKKQKKYTL